MISQIKLFLINTVFLIISSALIFAPNFTKATPGDLVSGQSGTYSDNFAFYLINHGNPLPKDFRVKTKPVSGNYALDVRCADYAIQMLEDAADAGISLVVCSAYRSPETQRRIFDDYVTRLVKSGYTVDEAQKLTEMQIAYPDKSEHCAGLALDIVSDGWFLRNDDLTEDFEYTREYKWLSENSFKYGFIMRYPKDKTDITGYLYEPWHYRFIGLQKAEQVYCSGLSLEEYIDRYPNSVNEYF